MSVLKKSVAGKACEDGQEMVNHAIDDGGTIPNPAARLGNHKKDAKKKIDPLTGAKSTRCWKPREKMPEHCPILCAPCGWNEGRRTGRRPMARHRLRRTVYRRAPQPFEGVIVTPKNGKTRRIDMSLQLNNTLEGLLAQLKAEAVKIRSQEKNEVVGRLMESPIFTRSDGRELDPNDLRRQIFYKVLCKAGMRRVRFEGPKHTVASLLIQQNEKLVYIKDQLGHSSI